MNGVSLMCLLLMQLQICKIILRIKNILSKITVIKCCLNSWGVGESRLQHIKVKFFVKQSKEKKYRKISKVICVIQYLLFIWYEKRSIKINSNRHNISKNSISIKNSLQVNKVRYKIFKAQKNEITACFKINFAIWRQSK